MSLVPERWGLLYRGRDPDTGYPMVLVAREKVDCAARLTVWKLVKRPNGWHNVGQWISQGRWRGYPEKNGVKLTDSRIDTALRTYAEG